MRFIENSALNLQRVDVEVGDEDVTHLVRLGLSRTSPPP